MAVNPSQIKYYGSANMPEADGQTVGGAVDFTRKITFFDLASASAMDAVSSSASDTATKLTWTGIDSSGVTHTSTVTLTGTTKVTSDAQVYSSLAASASSGATANGPLTNPGGTAAVGDVALLARTLTISAHTAQAGSANSTGVTPALLKLQSGDGASVSLGMIIHTTGGTGANQLRQIIGLPATYGTDTVAVNRDWGTLPDATTTYEIAAGHLLDILPQPITACIRAFSGATANAAGGAVINYYEKFFVSNQSSTNAYLSAQVIKESDPAGLYSGGGQLNYALCTALDDTGTTTNRQTVPASGIGSWSSGAAPTAGQAVSGGNLPDGGTAANAQGVWLNLQLAAGQAPGEGVAVIRTSGSSSP